MVLQVRHTTPTTPAGAGFNTEITNAVRIQTKKNLTESADLAEVASVEVLVDDPSASLSFVTRQAIVLDETEAPASDRRVFTGYIAGRALVRGTIGELVFPQGRVWKLECAEFNALIGWRIVRGEQSDRPQETVANRLLWLLSTTFLNGVDDLGLIDWPDPAFDIVMPPNDYEGQWGKAVLEDIAAQTGLGFFAHIDESVGYAAGLAMYDFNTYTGYASALRLSNVASDIDLVTTFPISFDAEWSADGERIAPGMYLTGADGLTSYGYNPDTQHAFGNIIRDQVAPMPNVRTQAALDAARARLLTQHQEEEERLTCRVQLPAAKVNAIRKGHSIEVKLSHVPGRTAFTWWRVTDRAVSTPEKGSQAVYDLDLELVPMEQSCTLGIRQQKFLGAGDTTPLDLAPIAGNLIVAVAVVRSATGLASGYTEQVVANTPNFITGLPEAGIRIGTRTVQAGDTAANPATYSQGWAPVATGGAGMVYELDGPGTVVATVARSMQHTSTTGLTLSTGSLPSVPEGALVVGALKVITWDVVPDASFAPLGAAVEDADPTPEGFSPAGWWGHQGPLTEMATVEMQATASIDHEPNNRDWAGAAIAVRNTECV